MKISLRTCRWAHLECVCTHTEAGMPVPPAFPGLDCPAPASELFFFIMLCIRNDPLSPARLFQLKNRFYICYSHFKCAGNSFCCADSRLFFCCFVFILFQCKLSKSRTHISTALCGCTSLMAI